MNEIAVLCSQGDLKITWDPSDDAEVAGARAEVAKLKEMGYSFFVADGQPADEVSAGGGELTFRRVEAEVFFGSGGTYVRSADAPPAFEEPTARTPPAKRGRRTNAEIRAGIAVPPMRGG